MNHELAEKKASELQSLMGVINNRFLLLSSEDFKMLSVDPVLWAIVSGQLQDASKIAREISKLCT